MMFMKRVLLFVAAFAVAWYFRWIVAELDRLGMFLQEQPGIVRLVMALLSVFVGAASIGDGFRSARWYRSALEIVVGVCIFFIGVQYWRTLF
jgi:hypothetical protein